MDNSILSASSHHSPILFPVPRHDASESPAANLRQGAVHVGIGAGGDCGRFARFSLRGLRFILSVLRGGGISNRLKLDGQTKQ